MRKVLFIFITLLVFVSACTERKRETSSLLQLAESLLYIHPDSAYSLLKNITIKDIPTVEDYNYYRLLYFETNMERNIFWSTDTTPIIPLLRYYQGKRDTLMMARAHRLMGYNCYIDQTSQAIKHYQTAIDYIKFIGDKRMLADTYWGVAVAYHNKGTRSHEKHLAYQKADSLYKLSKKLAQEIRDTLLMIRISLDYGNRLEIRKQYKTIEQEYLSALRLAEEKDINKYKEKATMDLSRLYGEYMKQRDKALYYAYRNIELREESLDEQRVCCLYLSNVFTWIGQKDSADYYKKKANTFPSATEKRTLRHREFEPIHMTYEETEERSNVSAYILPVVLLILVTAGGTMLWRHLRKTSLMRRELEFLSTRTPSVFDKMNHIVEDYLCQDRSNLRMEEADWKQLQWNIDKQWNNAVSRIQKEFRLNSDETHLLCLNLTELPTVHIAFLIDRKRNAVYERNRSLFKKLGIERKCATFKEDLENFIKNR